MPVSPVKGMEPRSVSTQQSLGVFLVSTGVGPTSSEDASSLNKGKKAHNSRKEWRWEVVIEDVGERPPVSHEKDEERELREAAAVPLVNAPAVAQTHCHFCPAGPALSISHCCSFHASRAAGCMGTVDVLHWPLFSISFPDHSERTAYGNSRIGLTHLPLPPGLLTLSLSSSPVRGHIYLSMEACWAEHL